MNLPGLLGVVANPASGKDVRRLVARASVFDNQEKQAIVSRALIGAYAAGAREVAYLDDAHGIVAAALQDQGGLRATALQATRTGTPLDTISSARALKDTDCAVVITLGGDGTNRAFAIGWPDAPLIPLSTGTNNVFPRLLEGTIAGAAAGLIASGRIGIDEVARQQKIIRVSVDGERDDLALIDAVLSRERFVGARALLSPNMLDTALLTRAEPAAVGLTAIGGLLTPVAENDDWGLAIEFATARNTGDKPTNDGVARESHTVEPVAQVELAKADASVVAASHRQLRHGNREQTNTASGSQPAAVRDVTVQAPIAPGLYRPVGIADCRTIQCGEPIEVVGPGVLAFDGERDRTLRPGQKARLHIERSGPFVVDVGQTLKLAAARGLFSMNTPISTDDDAEAQHNPAGRSGTAN